MTQDELDAVLKVMKQGPLGGSYLTNVTVYEALPKLLAAAQDAIHLRERLAAAVEHLQTVLAIHYPVIPLNVVGHKHEGWHIKASQPITRDSVLVEIADLMDTYKTRYPEGFRDGQGILNQLLIDLRG